MAKKTKRVRDYDLKEIVVDIENLVLDDLEMISLVSAGHEVEPYRMIAFIKRVVLEPNPGMILQEDLEEVVTLIGDAFEKDANPEQSGKN